MSTSEFLATVVPCFALMLVFRCLPLFVLKGRSLSPKVERALGYIPVAAFAGLVANDLFDPADIAADPLSLVRLLVAAAVVCLIAKKTRSLIWCAVAGMVALAVAELVL